MPRRTFSQTGEGPGFERADLAELGPAVRTDPAISQRWRGAAVLHRGDHSVPPTDCTVTSPMSRSAYPRV
jgi:hypothetical protein